MSTPPNPPLWAFIARLQTRADRMMVAWSFGSVPRAQAFRKWLAYGRLEKGSVVFKEALLGRMARDLAFPHELRLALETLALPSRDEETHRRNMFFVSQAWKRALANALQAPEKWPTQSPIAEAVNLR